MSLPAPTRLLTWYGDDFTGSTDVLDVLAPHLPTVLFLERPSDSFFAQFANHRAFGLASSARSQTPDWMDRHLPEAFDWLKSLNAAVCHYKVCSTFDSAPGIGSIGRALDIGHRIFGGAFVPIVVGAPTLRRYTLFGHLFAAAADGEVYRIDRHPAMSCHPVTPMSESDLRQHLAPQTATPIALHSALADPAQYSAARFQPGAVLIDVMDHPTLQTAGRLLWDTERQPFIVGSSGVEYALIAHWNLPSPTPSTAPPVDQLVVLSGSCSPATARQIDYAESHGFPLIAIDPTGPSQDGQATTQALSALSAGRRGVVLYSSRSPADRLPLTPPDRERLAERAGLILRRVLDQSSIRRVVIAGGDTSSHAGRQLGIGALTFIARMAPGAPLCQAWSTQPSRQSLEIVFKGGQMGRDNFFEVVQTGSTKETS